MNYFGKGKTKQIYFPQYNDNIIRLNNGSFGSCPKPVLDVQSTFRQKWLCRPDEYYFSGKLDKELYDVLAFVTSIFKDANDLKGKTGFTENATVAVNTVIRHWSLIDSPMKFVIVTDCMYKAYHNVYQEFMPNAKIIELKILNGTDKKRSLPKSRDELMARFELEWQRAMQEVDEEESTVPRQIFIHLDYISSQPAILFPVKDMLEYARSSRSNDTIHSIVDAAHTFLYEDFDLVTEYGDPDFAVINLHKWNFAPISASLLYHKDTKLHHIITSWNYNKGFSEECQDTGTRDQSAFIAAAEAIKFLKTWRSEEGMIAKDFCKTKLRTAVNQLTSSWGTAEIYFQSEDITPPSMAMVKLPTKIPLIRQVSDHHGNLDLRNMLRDEYNIECKVANFCEMGNYLRLSFAIYNTLEDVDILENAINDIATRHDS